MKKDAEQSSGPPTGGLRFYINHDPGRAKYMTKDKILSVVEMYRRQFEKRSIPRQEKDPTKTFKEMSSAQRLAHAHHLLDGIVKYAQEVGKEGKTGRHLASVQMILSFE